jgi:hypothetical protein
MKPDLQRHEDHEELQMKPDLQRHEDHEELQLKPDLQRHEDHEELQLKPDLQRHEDHEELQLKPDLQLKQDSSCSGCQCPSCISPSSTISIQTKADRAIGVQDLLSRKLEDAVNIQRQKEGNSHCSGCACGNCTAINTQVQRQTEQNHGSGCSCPVCSGGKDIQTKLIQTKPLSSNATPKITQATTPGVIQRHSAYEHYMLGQVDPSEISNIPMVREIPELEKQLDELEKQRKKAKSKHINAEEVNLNLQIIEAKKKKEEVRHTIEQEMNRLWAFKNDPEVLQGKAGDIGTVKKEHGKWQVPIVELPVKGDGDNARAGDTKIIVTYSEINTFPDFFGNPETIANTPKSSVLNLLQGVRQQAYIEYANLYKEIFGESKNKLADWENRENLGMTEGDFQGAVGPRGQAVNEWAYEKRTEMQVQGATERSKPEEKSQEYFAALERNACHFAPYSWEQWESYHQKARTLAIDSANTKEMAQDIRDLNGDESVAAGYDEEAKEKANRAMLQNAFGEHYLQDSFAAGHLIDKTGVMQAFTQWVNESGNTLGTTKKYKEQWKMASMIANKQTKGTNQDGQQVRMNGLQSNPQALDDSMMRGELDSVGKAANQVGLGATDEIKFMMWWRNAANANKANKHLTPQDAAQKCPIPPAKNDQNQAQVLMERLVALNFVEKKSTGVLRWKKEFYSLNKAQVDVLKDKGAYKATLAMTLHERGEHDYTKEAEEFNLAAYSAFMNNAYIQGATKYFHDKYCKEGLEVITGEGESIGRIYGDSKMISAGGQKGVKYSAETSQMSREAIFNLINDTPQQAATVPNIRKRFPTKVIVPAANGGKVEKSLAAWNAENLYTPESFKEAASGAAKIAYKFMSGGGISKGNAINVEGIVKHDGDVF